MRRLAVLLLLACSHASETRPSGPPAVRFEQATVHNASFDSGDLVLTWRVENPGPEDLVFKDWEPAVVIDGQLIDGPAESLDLEVPARETRTVSLKKTIDYAKRFGERRPAYPKYVATVNPKAGGRAYPVRHEGSCLMPSMPSVALANLHVDRAAESFDVTFVVRFSNANDFPVSVEQLKADVLVAGQRIGSLPAEPVQLPVRGKQEVVFKRTVYKDSLLGLARSALQSTEAVSMDVKGNATVQGRPMEIAAGGMIRPR